MSDAEYFKPAKEAEQLHKYSEHLGAPDEEKCK